MSFRDLSVSAVLSWDYKYVLPHYHTQFSKKLLFLFMQMYVSAMYVQMSIGYWIPWAEVTDCLSYVRAWVQSPTLKGEKRKKKERKRSEIILCMVVYAPGRRGRRITVTLTYIEFQASWGYIARLCLNKKHNKGRWNGSVGGGASQQVWWPGFNPLTDPHGRRRETSCLLTSIHAPRRTPFHSPPTQ